MRLVTIDDVPEPEVRQTFRYSCWGPLVALLLILAMPAVLVFIGLNLGIPWWGWIIAGVLGLLPALISWAILSSMWHIFAACFKPTNWVMKTTPEGVYLQFRSYINHHFPRDLPTVVYIPFEQIASANKTIKRIKTFTRGSDGGTHLAFQREKFLYLHFDEEVDTDALAQAVAEERAREAPRIGLTQTKFRSDHVPVQVPRPGVIQSDWRGRNMLEELQFHLRVTRLRRTGWGYHQPGKEPTIEEQVVAMVEQGRSMDAISLLRHEYGTSGTEGERIVTELTQNLARNPPPH